MPIDPLTAADKMLLADVKRDGWAVALTPSGRDGPGHGHTVGLTFSYKHPEILVIGLSLGEVYDLLRRLARAVAAGDRYEAGRRYPGVRHPHPVAFVRVSRRSYPDCMAAATRIYQSDRYPAVQCVWADAAGRFPWDPGAIAVTHLFQPVFGPPAVPAAAPAAADSSATDPGGPDDPDDPTIELRVG